MPRGTPARRARHRSRSAGRGLCREEGLAAALPPAGVSDHYRIVGKRPRAGGATSVNGSDPSGMFVEVDYGPFRLNSDGTYSSVVEGGGRGGGGADSFGLDTTFGSNPPIVWTINIRPPGGSSGSPGVGSPVASSVGPTGATALAYTWLYDRQSASREPDEVASWRAGLEREQPSRKVLDAAVAVTDAVEDALPTAEAVGDAALNMVPIYGSFRAWSRGDSFGLAISATSDVIFVLKFLRVGRYLVSGIRIGRGAEAAAVAGGTKSLAARAQEIHNALDPIAQNQRTTAILRTSGGNIVAGGAEDLIPAQRALLGAEEVAAKLRDAHAEITALQHAASSGLSPIEMVVTRTICPPCARAIAAAGGTLTSPTSAVWPR